jgi:hypothetical protein
MPAPVVDAPVVDAALQDPAAPVDLVRHRVLAQVENGRVGDAMLARETGRKS